MERELYENEDEKHIERVAKMREVLNEALDKYGRPNPDIKEAEDMGVKEHANLIQRLMSKHNDLPIITEIVKIDNNITVLSIFSGNSDPYKAKYVVVSCLGAQDKMVLTQNHEALIYEDEEDQSKIDDPTSPNTRKANDLDLDRYENALRPLGNIYPVVKQIFQDT